MLPMDKNNKPQLCKNCEHCYGVFPFGWEFVKCSKAVLNRAYSVDPVSGAKIYSTSGKSYCSIIRKYPSSIDGDCGKEGRFFTPRKTLLSFFFPR